MQVIFSIFFHVVFRCKLSPRLCSNICFVVIVNISQRFTPILSVGKFLLHDKLFLVDISFEWWVYSLASFISSHSFECLFVSLSMISKPILSVFLKSFKCETNVNYHTNDFHVSCKYLEFSFSSFRLNLWICLKCWWGVKSLILSKYQSEQSKERKSYSTLRKAEVWKDAIISRYLQGETTFSFFDQISLLTTFCAHKFLSFLCFGKVQRFLQFVCTVRDRAALSKRLSRCRVNYVPSVAKVGSAMSQDGN